MFIIFESSTSMNIARETVNIVMRFVVKSIWLDVERIMLIIVIIVGFA